MKKQQKLSIFYAKNIEIEINVGQIVLYCELGGENKKKKIKTLMRLIRKAR